MKHYLVLTAMILYQYCMAQAIDHQIDSLNSLLEVETTDSVRVVLYNALMELTIFSHPDESIEYAHQSLAGGKDLNQPDFITNAYWGLCVGHFYHGSPTDSLLKYLHLWEDYVASSQDEVGMMKVHWMYAFYHGNLNQSDKEIEAFLKALEIVQRNDFEPDTETGLLLNIGASLFKQDEYHQALTYFQEGLQKVVGKGLKADLLYHTGLVYRDMERYDTAFVLFNRAFENYEEVQDKGKMALTLIEQGKFFDHQKQFERARSIYRQALTIAEDNQVKFVLPEILVAFAEHYQTRQQYQRAIQYYYQALETIDNQQSFRMLPLVQENLQACFAAIGNYEQAYAMRGAQIIYKDSVLNAEMMMKVESLQAKFQINQKETENQLLKAEKAAIEKDLHSKNITALALLLGILLMGSWGLAVWRINRQKQKYTQKLENMVAERTTELQKANSNLEQVNYELKTLNFIASHDIKEPIRNIGNYVGLIQRKLPTTLQDNLNPYFETIKTSSNQLYTLVEDIASYTQMSGTTYLKKETTNLNLLLNNITFSLNGLLQQKHGKIINKGLPTISINQSLLYTILKNLIENGLKFNQSVPPIVTVSAEEYADCIHLNIKDNGIGIEPTYQAQIFSMFKKLHHREQYKGSGIGLAVVKLLMDKIGGTIQIKSEVGTGSLFTLVLPRSVSI